MMVNICAESFMGHIFRLLGTFKSVLTRKMTLRHTTVDSCSKYRSYFATLYKIE